MLQTKREWKQWWESTGKPVSKQNEQDAKVDQQSFQMAWEFLGTKQETPKSIAPVWIPTAWTLYVTFNNGDYMGRENEVWIIDREAENARAGRPSGIVAKMNSLVEPQIIKALYLAAQAGVQIDLVVRGICSLRPGVPGVSDNIRVRSIIGRFLEHTRVFYFVNGEQPVVYLSSADWMGRNFFSRVETCFPIDDPDVSDRILKECRYYLDDNCQAWELAPDGSYEPINASPGERFSAQEKLLAELAID